MDSSDYSNLLEGKPPVDKHLLRRLSVGVDFVTDFWREQYLEGYIADGGSKIKFLTGSEGSGKTHCLSLFLADAENSRFKTVYINAKQTWLHDFREIYAAVFQSIDFLGCLVNCSSKIIYDMGYDPNSIPPGMSFADYLKQENLLDPITRREIRTCLSEMFFKDPKIDKNFAISASLICGGILGYPVLEQSSQELLLDWLAAEKVKLPQLRKLGLSPSRITKYNARHMLRSLTQILCFNGYKGLVIGIDNLEILANTNALEEIRYSKVKREDAYESIRQLIDDIDTLSHLMVVFAFDRLMFEDEMTGLKSYQALWMRIQNEIESPRVNRFADIIDLDRVAAQRYDAHTLNEMSHRLVEVLNESASNKFEPVPGEIISELLSHSSPNKPNDILEYRKTIPLPLYINRKTIGVIHE